MKVLFVDDEERILSGIENALVFAPGDWDADFVNSGEEAIRRLDAEAYDVLVTDMKMPGLTGADVLEHVRARHPTVVRIVLSGEVDAKLAERAMPILHEFVPKPCDPDDLFGIIERVYTASRQIEPGSVRDVLNSFDGLLSQPELHARIQESLNRDEGTNAVARVIEADIAIATAVLKTANSAFYGFRSPAKTVREAVSRLGTETVGGIVLNAEIGAGVPPEMRQVVETLNAHAAQVSDLVRELIGDEVSQASLAALLHDLGTLVQISQFPEKYEEFTMMNPEGAPIDPSHEEAVFGVGHAEIGAYMLTIWNIDPLIVDSVRHHHTAHDAEGDARKIIDAIAAAEHALSPEHPVPEHLDPALVDRARKSAAGKSVS